MQEHLGRRVLELSEEGCKLMLVASLYLMVLVEDILCLVVNMLTCVVELVLSVEQEAGIPCQVENMLTYGQEQELSGEQVVNNFWKVVDMIPSLQHALLVVDILWQVVDTAACKMNDLRL